MTRYRRAVSLAVAATAVLPSCAITITETADEVPDEADGGGSPAGAEADRDDCEPDSDECDPLTDDGNLLRNTIGDVTGLEVGDDEVRCLQDAAINSDELDRYFSEPPEDGPVQEGLIDCLPTVTASLGNTVWQLFAYDASEPWDEALCLSDQGIDGADVVNVTLNRAYQLATLEAMDECLSAPARRAVAEDIVATFTVGADVTYDIACSNEAASAYFDEFGFESYASRSFVDELFSRLVEAGCTPAPDYRGLPEDDLAEFLLAVTADDTTLTDEQLLCLYRETEAGWNELDVSLTDLFGNTVDAETSAAVRDLLAAAATTCAEQEAEQASPPLTDT